MLAEIVLPNGTGTVTVKDIPELFATAIHPELPSDTPRQVIELKKYPLTEPTKNQWCGLAGNAFPVSLKDDDLAKLERGCWKQLPALRLPIDEANWQPYLKSFQKKPPQDWKLCVTWENPSLKQRIYWHDTVAQYKKTIEQAVLHGQLIPRSPHTLLPMPDAMGETLLDCFVTVADLTNYAAQINIGVRIADSHDERETPDAPDRTNANNTRPQQQQKFQEDEILRAIGDLSYIATALPKRTPGKPGVKAEVRRKFNWQGTVFNKAWDRLRYQKRIADKT